MEVAPGIHRIEAPLGERFVALFLLVGAARTLLVDTGLDSTPRDHLLPYLEQIGLAPERIDLVLISHADFDHSGGNAALRAIAPRALFLCHALDRPQIEEVERLIGERYGEFAADHGLDEDETSRDWIRANTRHVPVDIELQGGERVHLGDGWRIDLLHTPGHSRGHLTVYDERSRTAIVADAVLGRSLVTKSGEPAFPPTYRYLGDYLGAVQTLQGLAIDRMLTSHFPVYEGPAVADFLNQTRGFTAEVDAALRNALAVAVEPPTLVELAGSLAPRLGRWPAGVERFLAYPLLGHLEQLVQAGAATVGRRDGWTTWRLVD